MLLLVRGPIVASVLAVSASIAGCQVYDPGLLERADSGPVTSRQPPPRPVMEDSGDQELAFGMRMVVMDQGNEWAAYGYDVDETVTTGTNRVAQCTPPNRPAPPVDGDEGVDNVFGSAFFPLVLATTPDLEQSSRRAQEEGHLPVVRVLGWNGQPDDPRVDLSIMQAVFTAPGGDETEPPPVPADPTTVRPRWDGRDWSWVRDDVFLEGDITRPLIRDDNAYVAGNVIVARLPSRVDIVFPADRYGVLVRLTDAVVTGRISEDRTGVEDVIVSGRWSINDLLGTARNIGVCPGERDYDLLVGQLDIIADVRSDPSSGGEGVSCDAISIGVGFVGSRLRVAGVVEGIALRDLCSMPLEDGGVDDGGVDGGLPDAGAPDAGSDAGQDAGEPDAGEVDAAADEDAGG